MNITHAVKEELEGDRLVLIFNRQKELMEKYHNIELRSGLLQTEECPVNLDDKRGQARIKDFAWRITEEIGEALEALDYGDEIHYKEELIDGLHFLTELTILAGFDFSSEYTFSENNDGLNYLYSHTFDKNCSVDILVRNIVKYLGIMCNHLKNKPWKQTNMITDKEAFYSALKEVWYKYFSLLCKSMTTDDIAEIYFKKSQVNKFRQRSNY